MDHIYELKEKIASLAPSDDNDHRIVADLIRPGDFVVLVVPIDKAAPKGRLILPQQQTIRDILDCGATAIVTRDSELEETLKKLGTKPSLVITDSQAFAKVSKLTPADIPLTSFFNLILQDIKEIWIRLYAVPVHLINFQTVTVSSSVRAVHTTVSVKISER